MNDQSKNYDDVKQYRLDPEREQEYFHILQRRKFTHQSASMTMFQLMILIRKKCCLHGGDNDEAEGQYRHQYVAGQTNA